MGKNYKILCSFCTPDSEITRFMNEMDSCDSKTKVYNNGDFAGPTIQWTHMKV